MRRVLVLVEGQTEETFFRETIEPHLAALGTHARCTCICTRLIDNRRAFRGGHGHKWQHIERDVRRLLGSNPDLATTMIDLYQFPRDLPGYPSPLPGKPHDRALRLEQAFASAIDHQSFLPGLMVHEFEALLFSDVSRLVEIVSLDASKVEEQKRALKQVRDGFDSPEDIDDGRNTAPSKRIEQVLTNYDKVLHGPRVANAIGLAQLRSSCPLFDAWLKRLEALGP